MSPGSGTGNPLQNYPTAQDILDAIRTTLPDPNEWPDTLLLAWIADAVRFYTATFPTTPDGLPITPPTTAQDYVLVPAAHREAIYQYIAYRAITRLMADEAITVDTSNVSIVLSQLTDTSRAMWTRYKDIMDKIAYEARGNTAIITWPFKRIY